MDTAIAITTLCNYSLENGAKCNSPKVVARGYCDTHYRALKRAGAFVLQEVPPLTKSATVIANVRAIKRATRKLLKNAPDYVDIHLAASRNAAIRGDSKPAEWALLHTRVVEPVMEKGSLSPAGTTINIGVKVSGTDK